MDVKNQWEFIKQRDKLMEEKKSLWVIKYKIDLYSTGTYKLEADWIFWGIISNYLLYHDTYLDIHFWLWPKRSHWGEWNLMGTVLQVPHFCACLPGGRLGPFIHFLGPRICEDAEGVLVPCCGSFSCLLVDMMLR